MHSFILLSSYSLETSWIKLDRHRFKKKNLSDESK